MAHSTTEHRLQRAKMEHSTTSEHRHLRAKIVHSIAALCVMLLTLTMTSCGFFVEEIVAPIVSDHVVDAVNHSGSSKSAKGNPVNEKQKAKEQARMKAEGKCPQCLGMGKTPDGLYQCDACKGTGKYTEQTQQ